MGRYAQARRRGGGAPPPPPAPVFTTIIRVEVDGTSNDTLNWIFSEEVHTVGATVPELEADDGSGMISPDSTGNPNLTTVSAQYLGKTFAPGDAWQLLTDPAADLTAADPFQFPVSGMTV